MSEQIDWSKAPEGATHWEPKTANVNAGWMRLEDGKWFFWPISTREASDIRWHECRSDMSVRSEYMIPRPTTPSWSGEGLPPVGVVCEANFVGGWTEFEMRYYGESYVIFKTSYEVQRTRIDFDTCGVKFRPIRTPEQVASGEREEFARTLTFEMGKDSDNSPNAMSQARRMYDLGYRKP